ncbi:serine/threonine-protein kinase [Nannocystis pusilla]|uniref:serine/threonine-protein kinase n=1 Tax=Nannocystis pusilla TaxID=889268 RepID=UPI003B7C5E6D
MPWTDEPRTARAAPFSCGAAARSRSASWRRTPRGAIILHRARGSRALDEAQDSCGPQPRPAPTCSVRSLFVGDARGTGPTSRPARRTPACRGRAGPPARLEDEERYQFGPPFAAGGLGVLRKAYDRRLRRVVAVKELRSREPGAARRFELEAAITARLEHPAIVPLYDVGRSADGEPYYCMKLIDGDSLEQLLGEQTTLAGRLALLEHVLTVADAIAYAHDHGVIHRDLKPANILVGSHGETVVIDWGLAKDARGEVSAELVASRQTEAPEDATLTDVGTIVGTPRYMPPEQARGEAVDARSDVFSLGAVLFHLLVGRAPFAGLERRAVLYRLADEALEDLRTLAADAPPELVAIVQKAMSPRPGDRYPGAQAFAADLRRFLTGRLVGAHRYRPDELLRLWLRRHRGAATVAALALVTLAATTLMYLRAVGAQRDRAELARAESERRATAAALAQAHAALGEDLVESLALLRPLDLAAPADFRRARLIALAAAARGAPDRVLRGHVRPIGHLAALADGGLVSIDGGGAVWRWDIGAGSGGQVVDLAAHSGTVIAAAEAPVWAALADERALVFRGHEPPETIDLAPLGQINSRTGPTAGSCPAVARRWRPCRPSTASRSESSRRRTCGICGSNQRVAPNRRSRTRMTWR